MDELNSLRTEITEQTNPKQIEDDIYDLLILSYLNGNKAGNIDISGDYEVDVDSLEAAVDRQTAGKSALDRVREYLKDGTVDDIMRVADTESHRCYNEGLLDVARLSNANKTWVTMLDDKVRDAHFMLEGVTVGFDEYFYTDGDSALAPGGFERADLNCNCRCELILSM